MGECLCVCACICIDNTDVRACFSMFVWLCVCEGGCECGGVYIYVHLKNNSKRSTSVFYCALECYCGCVWGEGGNKHLDLSKKVKAHTVRMCIYNRATCHTSNLLSEYEYPNKRNCAHSFFYIYMYKPTCMCIARCKQPGIPRTC